MISTRSPRGIRTCEPRRALRRRSTALAIVLLMVSVSVLAMIPAASAVSQRFSENHRNDTDANIVPEGWPWTNVGTTIDVSKDVTVARVDIIANYVHGRRGDLVVRLRGPDGTTQQLWSNAGDNTPNLYLDTDNLANFIGKNAKGTWTMEAYDWWSNGITGNIDYWELLIYYDLSVTISNPTSGSQISGTYTVQAQVSNAATVELWMDGSYVSNMVYNGITSRWEYALDTSGYSDGMHNMQVIAEDEDGNRLADLIGVEVDNYDIFANIVAPADGSTVSGSITIYLQTRSYASWGSLTVDGSLVATSNALVNIGGNYYFTFTLGTTAYKDGNHAIIGTAYDPEGGFASDSVNYDIDNWAITASIVSPGDGTTISGSVTVYLNAPSYATMGVLQVDGILHSTDNTLTNLGGAYYFTFTLDTTAYKDGNHALTGTAYDPDGNYASDTNTNDFDNYAISCTIFQPAAGATLSGTYNVLANVPATAVKGELYVDDKLAGTDTTRDGSGRYGFSLDTTNYMDGAHTLRVVAYNALGDTASDARNVNFDNWAITSTIGWPTTGTSVSGTITVWVQTQSYATVGRLYVDNSLYQTLTPLSFGTWYLFTWDTTGVSDGIHMIRAEVDDPDGNTAVDTESPTVNNYAITVTITAPADGATISGTYTVRASVPSYATRGELYVDGKLAGIDTTRDGSGQYTYSLDTTLFTDGGHTVSVMAYDPDGATAIDIHSVTIDNYAITVTIQVPADGSTISGLVTVRAQTQAYAIKGELYIDGDYVAQDTTLDGSNRFVFQFDSTDYQDGQHKVQVKVYDPQGGWNVDTHTVTIDNYAISVIITNPTDGSNITGTITVRATVPSYATYGDLLVDDTFYKRDTTVSGGQFTYSFDTTDFADGNHILRVAAYDPDGNFAVDTIGVTIDNYDISVSFLWPVSGTTISGNSYNIWVQTDSYATKGELHIDGQLVQTRTSFVFSSWYQFVIDTRAFKDGVHSMTVRAYDPDGNFATDTIQVTVDNYQLTVTISSPASGATVSGTVNVRAAVQTYASLGECYLDDRLVSTDTTVSGGAYDFSFDSTKFKDGGHTIKVIAYDPEGTAAMASVTVTFNNWDISVNIFSPADGATVSGTINVLATVPTYATLGELYIDGQLYGTDTTVSSNRFQFSVNTRNYADGLHAYKVMAYDPDGMFAVDTNTYNHGNYDLDVTITAPSSNDIVAGTITVTARVDDTANSAKLYVDSLLVASSTLVRSSGQSYTFSLDSRGFTDGNHIIRVEASYSVSGESSYHSVPVTFDNTAPSLTSLSIIYLNGLTAVKASGDQVIVLAKAEDATTGVDKVMLDASNIGGGSAISMFDDGSHDDGESGDGVYGSDPIDALGTMGYHRTFVTAMDDVGNSVTRSISVAIDDHSPLVTNTYIIYPVGQSAAKQGDQIRVIANVVDTTVYVDVVLLIDTSGSMAGTPISDAKTAAKKFVDQIDPNDRSALYSFNSPAGAGGTQPKQEIAFTTNKANVKNKIDGLSADDWTPLYDTVFAATAYAKTSNNLPVLVVLTDGVDCMGTDNWGNCNVFSSHSIDDIKNASIPIFTIGLGQTSAINETALKAIAQTSNGGAYYYAPDSDDLEDIYDAIAAKVEDLEVGGISEVVADLSKIGSGTRNLMYDDGNHGDGTKGDNVFGSEMITTASVGTDKFDYWVNATDVGGNKATTKSQVYVDNSPPVVQEVKPIYSPNEWWVEDGDQVRVTANITDPGKVGGIIKVYLDATEIGGSSAVKMRDDGTSGDQSAGDGIWTSDQVTISTGLKTGIMEVRVTAYDVAMNPSSAKGNVYVDNYRPLDMDIVDPVDGGHIEGRFTFRATVNNVDAVNLLEISLMNQWYRMAYNAQSSFYELIYDTTARQDGTYNAVLQITDISAKTSPWTQQHRFSIDNTPPVLVVNYPTQDAVLEGQVIVNTTGTTDLFLTTVEYKVDDLDWKAVTEPLNTTEFVDGAHTIEFRAMDIIGHETTRKIDVIFDNGNPEGMFISPSDGEYVEGLVQFQVKATDLVSITSARLTGAVQATMQYNAITGYYEHKVDTMQMNDGSYAVGAEIRDIAGHRLVLSTITFHVDNNGPVMEILEPTDGSTVTGNVTVAVDVTDGPFALVTLGWRVDNGPWQPFVNGTAQWDTTRYADGDHQLHFTASDNLDRSVDMEISVVIDNNAPTIELTSPIDGQMIDGRYIFKMHSYDKVGVDRLVVEIEGVNNYTILNTAGGTYFELEVDTNAMGDGTYDVKVTSYDRSGFFTSAPVISMDVDNNPPDLVVYRPLDGEYISGYNYTITGTAVDVFISAIEYNIDGFGMRPIDTPLDTTFLAEGQHTIEVVARDEAGHTTTRIIKVYVDNSAPSISPVSPQEGESVSGSYTFRVRAEDANGIDKVSLRMGNQTLLLFQNSLTGYYEVTRDTTLDVDGSRMYTFTALDRSGKETNLSVSTRTDNSAPEVNILGPKDKAKGIVKFKVQVTDPSGIDRVLIRIGGGDWRDMRNEGDEYIYRWKTTEDDNGDQPYDIKVIDKLGNEEIVGYNLIVDNPSAKADYTWLWLLLVILLVVALLVVAVTSRPSSASRARQRERAYTRRFDEEDEGPEAIPGQARRVRQPKGTGPDAGPAREITTPQHRAAMRKLESEEIVVGTPEHGEVEVLSMDEAHGPPPPGPPTVVAPLRTVSDDEDVEFLDDDEVEFHDDLAGEDEVTFHDDEVTFHDDDDVEFHDDDDVEFLDDDDEVEFLDDTPAPGPPGPPSPSATPRRMPSVPLTARATPAPQPSGSGRTVTAPMKGIDDLLASGPSRRPPAPSRARPAPAPTPKPKDKKKGDDPLGELIGGI